MPAWTDSADRQLLLSIIHSASVPTPKWDQIAHMMGEGYTAEATRYVNQYSSPLRASRANARDSQRFQKLKRAGKEEFGEMAAVPTGAAPKGKARGKAAAPAAGAEGGKAGKKAGGKRKGKSASDVEDDEEGGELGESPEKKVKVKAEGDGEEGEEGDML